MHEMHESFDRFSIGTMAQLYSRSGRYLGSVTQRILSDEYVAFDASVAGARAYFNVYFCKIQPNVVATVQRRKMRNFEGYTRIAIVIIPSEEEYERMLEKWNDNTLRDTSISLLELKGAYCEVYNSA